MLKHLNLNYPGKWNREGISNPYGPQAQTHFFLFSFINFYYCVCMYVRLWDVLYKCGCIFLILFDYQRLFLFPNFFTESEKKSFHHRESDFACEIILCMLELNEIFVWVCEYMCQYVIIVCVLQFYWNATVGDIFYTVVGMLKM